MKKLLIAFFIGLNILLLAGIGGLLALWELHPIPPGGACYRMQDAVEQGRIRLTPNLVRRAELAMDLTERRLADLTQAEKPAQLDAAALAVGDALDTAARHIGRAPKTRQVPLWKRLHALLEETETVVRGIRQAEARASVATLAHRVETLQAASSTGEWMVAAPDNSLSDALAIPFLGTEIKHSSYPLTGAHRDVECEACHRDGKYVGTFTECSLCHELPDDPLYVDHFDGACAD